MKLIRKIDTKVVLYMFDNDREISLTTELIAGDIRALDINSEIHEIVTGVAAPSLFVGGALTFDGEWQVVDQAAMDSATAKSAGTLAALKAAKNLQINEWRAQANRSTFSYSGKVIACDELSRSDIDAVAGAVALNGAFPADFPNAWKATDNNYISLPDIGSFKAMYNAMTAQGTLNFARSQQLKSALASAQTAQEINAIKWEA